MEKVIALLKVLVECEETFEVDFRMGLNGHYKLACRSGDTFSQSCYWEAKTLDELAAKLEQFPEGEE